MSVSLQDAKCRANEYLLTIESERVQCALIESRITEDGNGWYFPYQSVEFIKTGDFNKSLVGNWPIFVSKDGNYVGFRRPEL